MWWKKILFTLTFLVYCSISYNVTYYLLEFFYPALLHPGSLAGQDFALWTGIFTGIVTFSFIGANYVVYGNATGSDD